MKVSSFNEYSDDEIRVIRYKLISKNIEELPENIKKYVEAENVQIGNQITRINRCVALIDKLIVQRFIN